MSEPIAYLNGQFVPVSQAKLSIFDLGIVAGASVTEMARTFRHIPFRLEEHLQRFQSSLSVIGVDPGLTQTQLNELVRQVVSENATLISPDADLGIIAFVTAGQNLTYLGRSEMALAKTPSVCIHTFPLPFELWADFYETGLHLVTTATMSLPDNVVDAQIKHRSRLHWHLADLEAKRRAPTAMAVLRDSEGFLTETATGNLCVVEGTTILTPERNVLKGVSRDVVAHLAASLGMTFGYTRLTTEDLSCANEAFLTSTPHCLLPVTQFNGQPIGTGKPGPVFQSLISKWSNLVGLEIADQMRRGAQARSGGTPSR